MYVVKIISFLRNHIKKIVTIRIEINESINYLQSDDCLHFMITIFYYIIAIIYDYNIDFILYYS